VKTRILISLFGILITWNAAAQSSEDCIAQGRSALARQDLTGAKTAFAQAVALTPNNETANAFYAVTRLLALPSQPAGSNFLTRLGFPTQGRNLYNWLSQPPADTNGLPLAPAGVDANEFVVQLRTTVLTAVEGALGNLAAITNTHFTLNLSSNETCLGAVTVDYGDLKLIQAALYGAEYGIYTANAHKLSAQLSDLRALYTRGRLSASQVLADYPDLLTFATPSDLQAARTAFTNGVSTYMTASAFIRSRPAGEVRLFSYDEQKAVSEANFRLTLQDLRNSLLAGPQWLTVAPDFAADMTPLFSGEAPLRSLLPKFDGNAIELGSFPDLTFGGVAYNVTPEDLEGALSKQFVMLPVGAPPQRSAGNQLLLPFTTLRGHYYSLLASTDLVNWKMVGNFTASNSVSLCTDAPGSAQRFYRLRDDSAFLAFAGEVLDYSTHRPIAGAQVRDSYGETSTVTDANGRFYLLTTEPADWGSTFLEVSAPGYGPIRTDCEGLSTAPALTIYLATPPANDNFANRTVLTGVPVLATGNNLGATQESGEPVAYGLGGKSVWFSWTAPASGSYTVNAYGPYKPYYFSPEVYLYTGTQLSNLSLTGYPGYWFTFSASAGQTYQLRVDSENGMGGDYSLSINQ
jgi:hypothetical protein